MSTPVVIFGLIGVLLIIIIIINKSKNKESFSSLGNNDIHTYANLTNNSDNPWTIDKITKITVTNIIKQILNKINEKTNMLYYFTAFDQLKHDTISPYNIQYTADFFVHEMKNLITMRILLIFIVNIKTKTIRVLHINLSNAGKNKKQLSLHSQNEFSFLKDIDFLPTPVECSKWILPLAINSRCNTTQRTLKQPQNCKYWDTDGITLLH